MPEGFEIKNPEYLQIIQNGERLYGCNQAWFQSQWHRKTGCGPTTATNLLLYLNKQSGMLGLPYGNVDVQQARRAMEDVFRYVHPTPFGVFSVRHFTKGVEYLAEFHGIRIKVNRLIIPPLKPLRPKLPAVLRFIEDGICQDSPVAFLNLHADKSSHLDDWHWITLIGVRTNEDGSVTATVYDNSRQYETDIANWLATAPVGGGFVYLSDAARCRPLLKKRQPSTLKMTAVTHNKCNISPETPSAQGQRNFRGIWNSPPEQLDLQAQENSQVGVQGSQVNLQKPQCGLQGSPVSLQKPQGGMQGPQGGFRRA